jgi:hypothetical protein
MLSSNYHGAAVLVLDDSRIASLPLPTLRCSDGCVLYRGLTIEISPLPIIRRDCDLLRMRVRITFLSRAVADVM